MKLVDLFGEVAKAKQIEGGHVLEESHAVDGFPFDHPGLFNDPLDLIFGTDSCGHSDNVDRNLEWMSSAEALLDLRCPQPCYSSARHPLTRPTITPLGLGNTLEDPLRMPARAEEELKIRSV